MTSRPTVRTLCLLAPVVLAGCGSVISITEKARPGDAAPATAVDGIPFYARKPQRAQETAWREIDLVATVLIETVPPARADRREAIVTVSRAVWNSNPGAADLRALHGTTVTETDLPGRIHAILTALLQADAAARAQRTPGHLPPAADLDLVSNRFVTQMVIDADRVYYVNARHPLVGSGLLEVEIAEDQTLKKAKAEIKDDTFKEILARLPLKEVLTAALGGLGVAGATAPTTWKITVRGSEQLSRTWTLRRERDTGPLPGPITAADVAAGGVEVAVAVPAVPVEKEKPKGTGAGNP